ncbi:MULTISPECIES: class I SAM-dependent methyltransferase [unclassified Acinetobacter]|uniref:class I SAM-dependent methyltransferase n=1 Tax=unclassified Acinetobacter TaxID=196816 RepID=UPI0018AC280B|nr:MULTISPECIES: class I SAM-dependent methyltransferase [unclassified Acinetobacter]MBJ9953163.1 class I SAM-dependent methyltransferase [Acinetobacter baumannii]
MNKIALNLQDEIADTLLITLYAKSVETRKKEPLINDPTACELVEKIDYDFSKYKNKTASSVGIAIRSTHFDQKVKRFIQQHQNPIIVFVGCGLDTRLQRMGESAQQAQFYQLDLDEVIEQRKKLLSPQENEHLIASSMLSTTWMEQLRQNHPQGNFMFVIEGVLMYFTEAQNQQVFIGLAERFSGAEIHFDMLNQWMSTKSALHDTVRKSKATFKFGMDDDKAIEAWHPKLKHVQTFLFNEFKGWRRMGIILTALMSVIPQMKTSSRILMYQIK